MHPKNRINAFIIILGIGFLLYIIISLFSSTILFFANKYTLHVQKKSQIHPKIEIIVDKLKHPHIDPAELDYESTTTYETTTMDYESYDESFILIKNSTNYIKMHPLDFEIQQQQTLDIIKGRYLNFSIPNDSSLNPDLSCGRFPLESDLNITDIYWQVTNTTNGTFYLYNAYYDDRKDVNGLPFVRILALINVLDPVVKTFCQFWYENVNEPLVAEVYEYRYIWNRKWGSNKKGASPYLISCEVPLSVPPSHVSLVERRCGSANNLMKVKNKRPKRNKKEAFIVSVKRFEFTDDISLQIIEWSEILKILGVNKVEFFVHFCHSNVLNVLKFYESEGFMNIKFIKYPSDFQNERKKNWHQYSQNQLISYHDTFYEHMYSYDFMVPMDTDEFIMPLRDKDRTWNDLLKRTIQKSRKKKKQKFDCYPVDNHYFLLQSSYQNEAIAGIPKNLYFLPNIYRANNFTKNGGNAKTFMKMDRVLTVHNHFPFSCLDDQNDFKCKRFGVAREDGQLSHYRVNCTNKECKESIDDPVRDESLWKFKDEIVENVRDVIERIKKYTKGEVDLKLEEVT